jgi:hypothetical protein
MDRSAAGSADAETCSLQHGCDRSGPPRDLNEDGGARRDRTDDLKLAKLPLSQLSYGPNPFGIVRHFPESPTPQRRRRNNGGPGKI